MYSEEQDHLPKSKTTSMLQARMKMNVLISNAYLVYSTLALERGTPQAALAHAKQSVRLLRRAWANVEEQLNGSRPTTPEATSQNGTEKSAEELSQLNISQINIPTKSESQRFANGSSFWALITPLFRALSHLSGLFAHNGMFQETVYYAEQARKLVKDVGADAHLAMASAMLGSNWLRAGVLDKGSEFLIEAKNASIYIEQSRETAILSCHLGTMHGLLGDRDAEVKVYEDAEKVLEYIATPTHIDNFVRTVDISDELEEKMSQMTISKRKPPVTRKAASRPRTAGKRKTTAGATSPVEAIPSVAEVCPQLTSLRARVLRQKAHTLMADKKYADALNLLHEAENFVKTHIEAVDHGLAIAKQLLLQSIEQMNADPVYSVLQDSTISFPSITGAAKTDKHGDRLFVAKVSPPRKLQGSKNSKDRALSKSPAPHSFFDKLRQAQEQLTEMHSVAMTFAPMASIHKISVLLNSVSILLSAAGQVKGRLLAHPGFASCSIGMTCSPLEVLHTNNIQKRPEPLPSVENLKQYKLILIFR
jgi:separase